MLQPSSLAQRLRTSLDHLDALHDRVKLLLEMCQYHLVEQPQMAAAVQELRYRAYFEAGAVEDHPDGRLGDHHDHDPHAATIAVAFEGTLCASIRLHVVTETWQGSPAIEAFPEELRPLTAAGVRLVDANCFCVDPVLSGKVSEFAYLMLRLPFITADLRANSMITATVTARHKPFYVRTLRCDEIAPPRPYAGRARPLGLTLCDIARERANIVRRNPSFEPLPGEAQRIGLDRIGMLPRAEAA